MAQVTFSGNLLGQLPLNRRRISEELNKGPSLELLRYLTSHFWVTEETDSNDDLGFVFALKPLEVSGEKLDGYYKLYLSCVLPCSTMRVYSLDKNGNASCSSVAVSESYMNQTRSTRLLKAKLLDMGYEFLESEQMSQEPNTEILKKVGQSTSYFNLLFSEY